MRPNDNFTWGLSHSIFNTDSIHCKSISTCVKDSLNNFYSGINPLKRGGRDLILIHPTQFLSTKG